MNVTCADRADVISSALNQVLAWTVSVRGPLITCSMIDTRLNISCPLLFPVLTSCLVVVVQKPTVVNKPAFGFENPGFAQIPGLFSAFFSKNVSEDQTYGFVVIRLYVSRLQIF